MKSVSSTLHTNLQSQILKWGKVISVFYLQLFVGKVDEKLLEAVVLEALKAENVQDT